MIKVIYRDGKYRIRLVDVRMAQKIDGKWVYAGVQDGERSVEKIEDFSGYAKYLKLGKRIKITYFVSTTSNKLYPDVLDPESDFSKNYCNQYPFDCTAAKIAKSYQKDYLEIPDLKYIPKNIDFLTIGIGTDNVLVVSKNEK